ncbi:TetR/AcrR family transcriptional regulator [Amycolatopsis viridis]|uniref:AcrR family transcriptional regulator n=1 Tax=Amycolatopsis viridis TaxID=185678 RepID=A0ABX0SUE0_9PSEU|nr:TetR family transcriptional regulator [Amycolatopsis viridis]NIH78980.1 AcrR family transcriptional regulator [Amycolatopsis viridis]
MQPDPTAAFGRKRRPRLSDRETERLLLTTAAAAVARDGLRVGLDHIQLEELIRQAGVARSAVYRRWPNKEAFLGDLLLELAAGEAPLAATGSDAASALVRRILSERLDTLTTPDGRRAAAAELIRETTLLDFQHILGSPQWRTYLALTVTVAGLPEGDLRHEVTAALAASERTFTGRIAHSHRVVADLLGLRPAHPGVSFETIAHLGNALVRGLITKATATPELAEQRVPASIGGASGDWSLPALGLAAITLTYLEPDPEVTWTEAGLARLRARLDNAEDLFAPRQDIVDG